MLQQLQQCAPFATMMIVTVCSDTHHIHAICVQHKCLHLLQEGFRGAPATMYAPQTISFSLGSAEFGWHNFGPFPVQNRDCLQTFDIPMTLCVGGELMVRPDYI